MSARVCDFVCVRLIFPKNLAEMFIVFLLEVRNSYPGGRLMFRSVLGQFR